MNIEEAEVLAHYYNAMSAEDRALEFAYQERIANDIWDDVGQIYCPSADAAPGEVFYW